MKVCPKCQKKYDDETLNFCLDDGSVLNKVVSEEPPPTVMMGSPAPTEFGGAFPTKPTQPSWEDVPKYEPHTGSGGKTWLWAVGILGAIVLLCGGGFAVLALIGVMVDEGDDPTNQNNERPVNNDDTKSSPEPERDLVKTIQLKNWKVNENQYITSERRDGELVLTSKDKYYYVILTTDFTTSDASVKLTLRNTTGAPASLGYGLIVHSDPREVLAKDYAFLIRSDTQQYRIARHTNKVESNIVGWTKSAAINPGTEENVLEVRVYGKDMKLYINGKFVRTEKDFSNYQMGVAGIYTSGDVPIGFSTMEHRK